MNKSETSKILVNELIRQVKEREFVQNILIILNSDDSRKTMIKRLSALDDNVLEKWQVIEMALSIVKYGDPVE